MFVTITCANDIPAFEPLWRVNGKYINRRTKLLFDNYDIYYLVHDPAMHIEYFSPI